MNDKKSGVNRLSNVFAATVIACLCTLAVAVPAASADGHTSSNGEGVGGIDVEWDPSVLLLRGFSAVVAVGPKALPSWRFAVDVFTFQYPSSQLDEGWRARAYGGSLIARYHPFGSPRGLWLSANLRVGQWTYTHEPSDASDTVTALSVQARVGYNWFPFGGRFYVNPQVGIAVPIAIDDQPAVGAEAHSRLSPFPVPALHVGYSF